METLVNIDVPDLDAAIDFYQRATPLRLGRRLFQGTVAELGGASTRIFLLQNAAGSAATAAGLPLRDYRRHWTPVHLDFVVPDVESATQKAVAAGASLEAPIRDNSWGRIATLGDPFGHGFCLLEWKGAGYDEVESSRGPDGR